MAEGRHPVPFRTRKLSPPAPMVLPWRRGGRVGRRRDFLRQEPPSGGSFAFRYPSSMSRPPQRSSRPARGAHPASTPPRIVSDLPRYLVGEIRQVAKAGRAEDVVRYV